MLYLLFFPLSAVSQLQFCAVQRVEEVLDGRTAGAEVPRRAMTNPEPHLFLYASD